MWFNLIFNNDDNNDGDDDYVDDDFEKKTPRDKIFPFQDMPAY